MWAYVDESGNTGNRIFDEEQPLFVTAAMATKTNFDLVYRGSRHESAFYAPLGRTNGQHCLCRFDSWRLGLGRLAFAEAL
jgi:hypothetical protein